ncbi:MAG: NAD synthetase [Bdellovibrio sp.]|nr:MAG: NAD synthetase [Bdellovibrio sp.]
MDSPVDSPDFFASFYLVATVLFILGLKSLSHPKTAVRGNLLAMVGMTVAIATTLRAPEVQVYTWIAAGIVAGMVIAVPLALKIKMTAMPQLVAALHSFVGLSAVLIAVGTFITHSAHHELNGTLEIELALGSAIGAVTFSGSVIAFAKLQELLRSSPLLLPGRHWINMGLVAGIGFFVFQFLAEPTLFPFLVLTLLALALGFLLVLPIGGADMPVVVSMLNSYSGWAASATGFTLSNHLLIATGALVGSSGAILSYIMCIAMNRSFVSVILGGFGATASDAGAATAKKNVQSAAPDDVAFMLDNASKVIIVPGYGLAVAQAQHAAKELFEKLHRKGIDIRFAIHPVAGRMPGHMNVLLAESEIPYDVVFEMEEINNEFSTTDVVLVIGANDVVNPDAKNNRSSPLYGMPILDAYKAHRVYVFKRSMKPGYAGVDNALFYYDNCSLVFGDAKASTQAIVNALG